MGRNDRASTDRASIGETPSRASTIDRHVDTSIDTHPVVEEIRVVIVVIIISARRCRADDCEVDARGRGGGVFVVDVLIRVRLRVLW